jgi:uncharacterized protein YjiK
MLMYFNLWLILLLCPLESDNSQEIKKLKNYILSAPTSYIILPDVLVEISGITIIDSITFACVQDEMGIIFIYDSRKGQIINKIPFAGPGDFEGITRAGNALYVLRSDGVLYEVSDYRAKVPALNIYNTGIPAKDNEGLCYDGRNNRLLIACKQGYTDDNVKHKQLVYSFDLKTKKLSKEPVIALDIKILRKILKDNDIKIPGTDKDDLDDLNFHASDIGINPVTGKIFIISAPVYLLIVTDMSGMFESVAPLKKELFRQAEGITFNNKGDLYISNEGAGKSPVMVRFNFIKSPSTATIH